MSNKELEQFRTQVREIVDEEIQSLFETLHRAAEEACRTGNTGIKVYYDRDNMHIQLKLPLC